MTTITKDRLLTIKQWRETYGPGSNVVLPAEEAEELARIALASLEAEPVAWTDEEELRDVRKYGFGEIFQCPPDKYADPRRVISLYRELPAPVVPDKLPREHMGRQPCHQITASMAKSIALKLGAELNNEEAEIFADGYNAAVLHGAKPVSQTYKLNKLSGNSPVTPDGWISRFEEMPDPSSEKRVCAFTPTNHEDMRYRFVPASLFKTVCRDATHWFYMLPPVGREEVAGG